ncbi:sensor histidine kinase [Streptomyces sp. ODS05-4]|uniref:sensor histidine kinase n=1 Tax=Streptomyces sp. ODS05-4 TaxID=2944939 RepID=UPI00210BCDA7|nr:ATP-binding protein [Streptomyces sp. ODS05-4]
MTLPENPPLPGEKSPPGPRRESEAPVRHLRKALRSQAVLRIAVIVALGTDFAISPPPARPVPSVALTVVYALWTLAVLWASWQSRRTFPGGLYPFVDLALLTALMTLSGEFSDPTWDSPVSADVLLLIPVLASFQRRPVLTAVSGVLAATAYTVGTGLGHQDEPYWGFILVHALFILVVCAGCVLLSAVQQDRVRLIGELAEHRLRLLDLVMAAEEREQRGIAEVLHDGALQNVLAARHFVDEASSAGADAAHCLRRADEALTEASTQLRSSVRTLHPEVLASGGLVVALRLLTAQAAERGRFHGEVRSDVASAGEADQPLYWLAREMLENVVKHARAENVLVDLRRDGPDRVRLTIRDDGRGIRPESVGGRLRSGHIGIASHRARVEGMGGAFDVRRNTTGGTTVEAVVPVAGEEAGGAEEAG